MAVLRKCHCAIPKTFEKWFTRIPCTIQVAFPETFIASMRLSGITIYAAPSHGAGANLL
jgi:hypothetical protein